MSQSLTSLCKKGGPLLPAAFTTPILILRNIRVASVIHNAVVSLFYTERYN
jgi:hypothetical protein